MSLDIPLAIIRNDDLLLFQRRKKEPYKDLLGLLGGKKEKKESLRAAIKREIFEESGLKAQEVNLLGIVREEYYEDGNVFSLNLHIFHVSCLGTIRHNNEEGETIWVSRMEFESFREDFIPTDWIVVKNFLDKSFKDFSLNVFKLEKEHSIIVNC